MEVQPLWKADEVAKYLSVPVSTIRYWTCNGKIPHIKLPASVRYEPEVIVNWARSMIRGATPAEQPREIASRIFTERRTKGRIARGPRPSHNLP